MLKGVQDSKNVEVDVKTHFGKTNQIQLHLSLLTKLSCRALDEPGFDLLSGLPEPSRSPGSITLKGAQSGFDGVHRKMVGNSGDLRKTK